MPAIYLVSAAPGDHVPGYELADPDCPDHPGLLKRPDVSEWLAAHDYDDDHPDELVYLVTGDDGGAIPAGFDVLTVKL
ncbi:hypothetical protein ACGF0D_10695 [Kitasatospora sp. NPDC048298]|uniref:hypothetical protein n=1 Tax=Kitasatospora sp. NPDC048298 TaxID=3364049 RepID=UPI0037115736